MMLQRLILIGLAWMSIFSLSFAGSESKVTCDLLVGDLLVETKAEVMVKAMKTSLMIDIAERVNNISEYIKQNQLCDREMLNDHINFHRRFIVITSIFTMEFTDMCWSLWYYPEEEATVNKWKGYINSHIHEDSTHYLRCLQDYQTLGLNVNVKPVNFLNFWYGSDAAALREVTTTMTICDTRLHGNDDPLARYYLMEILEEAGNILFQAISRSFDAMTDCAENTELKLVPPPLLYAGNWHSTREVGDLFIGDKGNQAFKEEAITNKNSALYTEQGVIVLDSIISMFEAMGRFMQSGHTKQNMWKL